MTHRPTFTQSSERRPLVRRLTPLAWALIAVAGLVLVIGLGAGLFALAQGRDRALVLPPTATPEPTEGPSPTPEPSATATVWYEGMLTPTPTEAPPPYPAWWSDQMSQDEDGQWWPPEGVAEMVEEAYEADEELYRTMLIDTKPPDYNEYEKRVGDWASGDQLAGSLNALEEYRAGDCNLGHLDWSTCVRVVQDWSEDGQECTLGVTCQDGSYSEYDAVSGDLLGSIEISNSGLTKYRMHYDPYSGHWKNDQFIEIVGGEELFEALSEFAGQ